MLLILRQEHPSKLGSTKHGRTASFVLVVACRFVEETG